MLSIFLPSAWAPRRRVKAIKMTGWTLIPRDLHIPWASMIKPQTLKIPGLARGSWARFPAQLGTSSERCLGVRFTRIHSCEQLSWCGYWLKGKRKQRHSNAQRGLCACLWKECYCTEMEKEGVRQGSVIKREWGQAGSRDTGKERTETTATQRDRHEWIAN